MAFISFSDRRSAIPDAVISVLENPLPDFVDGKEVPKKGGMGATLSGPGYFAYVNVIPLYPKFPIIFSFKVCIIEGNVLSMCG